MLIFSEAAHNPERQELDFKDAVVDSVGNVLKMERALVRASGSRLENLLVTCGASLCGLTVLNQEKSGVTFLCKRAVQKQQ